MLKRSKVSSSRQLVYQNTLRALRWKLRREGAFTCNFHVGFWYLPSFPQHFKAPSDHGAKCCSDRSGVLWCLLSATVSTTSEKITKKSEPLYTSMDSGTSLEFTVQLNKVLRTAKRAHCGRTAIVVMAIIGGLDSQCSPTRTTGVHQSDAALVRRPTSSTSLYSEKIIPLVRQPIVPTFCGLPPI